MKRAGVPFDAKYFEKKKKRGEQLTTEETFKEIFNVNHWIGKESVSGQGSSGQQTNAISKQIPALIKELGISKFLDVPCGDFHWFGKLDCELDQYIGGDIITEIIDKNNALHGRKGRNFLKMDLIQDQLPDADLLHCRDCFVHFSNQDIHKAIENIKQSNIYYLLTTTFTACNTNIDIVTGDWRIINLEKAPFGFTKPLKLISEKCTEGNGTYADKCLGLWRISDL